MLPKRWRLPIRKEGTFFDKAERRHLSGITSFYVKNNLEPKFGAIVPKKQIALSTNRHKITRRFYHALSEIIQEKSTIRGHFVFVLSQHILNKTQAEIKKIIFYHLDQHLHFK